MTKSIRIYSKNFFIHIYGIVFNFPIWVKIVILNTHTDSRTKLISLMLYFPTEEMEGKPLGTTFYHSKDKDFLNIAQTIF